MIPKKLNIMIARFAYGGNGGISSELPDIGSWLVTTVLEMKADERIGEIKRKVISDTPITMTRNQSVVLAKQNNCDLILMIDSDMKPDLYLGRMNGVEPFWKSSFDFIYDHYDKGPAVIASPYCMSPPDECVCVFEWRNLESGNPNVDHDLDMLSREEAARRGGISEVAAIGTGLILYDIRCFDELPPPWFYYEYEKGPNGEQWEHMKASTEDVVNTRALSMMGIPVYCNWDSWSGHMKPKCVGKPMGVTIDSIREQYADAIRKNRRADEQVVDVGAGSPAYVQGNGSRLPPLRPAEVPSGGSR